MSNVQSIERALNLLKTLSNYPEGIQITRLSEQVGMTKSTTHRLLSTLVNMHYVTKDAETDKYKLGTEIIYLSRNLLSNMNVINVAKPYLEKLSRDVNETVHLCIADHGQIMYVDKIESNRPVRMSSQIGSRAPMYCTGIGKVLLSGMPEHQYEEIVSKTEFVLHTPQTVKNKEELFEQVQRAKELGYALDDVEKEDGLRCIAAPIYDFSGMIIASFSISGPAIRITKELIENTLVERVRITSQEISRNLGYIGIKSAQ